MSTNWEKHFYEQVINKGNYDPIDQTVLEEMFRMYVGEFNHVDEGGQCIGDEERIKAYSIVIDDFLVPAHYGVVRKIQEDIRKQFNDES